MSHLCTRSEIRRSIPEARVHPTVNYPLYLKNLAKCDMRLGTFPFGGANSNVDSALLGIPSVIYKGAEPQSRTDYRLTRLFDLPDWLVAENEADYEAAALRLIEDDALRVALSRQILEQDPHRAIFDDPSDFYPNDYIDLFSWIYENHEQAQESGRKLLRWEDRQKPGEG